VNSPVTVVRCPFCVWGDEFRPMVSVSGDRFVCGKCGHVAIPSDKKFECPCWKCAELRACQPMTARSSGFSQQIPQRVIDSRTKDGRHHGHANYTK